MSQSTPKFGQVALVGPPNAGKSTLLNALCGEKIAIVSSKPQTTRNQITGILSESSGQILFIDTPGLHKRGGKMNRAMLHAAHQALSSADAVVLALDVKRLLSRAGLDDPELRESFTVLKSVSVPLLVAVNKTDLVRDKKSLLPVLQGLQERLPEAELFPISALKADGVHRLKGRLFDLLPEGAAKLPEDQLTTLPVRFMASEIIREKLFERLHQELPYLVAVEVEDWAEDPNTGFTTVRAVIFVGRDSHKGVVIGKRGAMLKEVGQTARLEIEALTQAKVHLELWVKVKEGWTEDPVFLRALGLSD